MRGHNHIAAEVLREYAESRTDEATAGQVRAHLDAGCARCAGDLAFWERALAALHAPQAPAVPRELVRQAINLFDQRWGPAGDRSSAGLARPPAPLSSVWERVVARLTFDSRLQPSPVGARDVGLNAFQLLFEADGTEIDMLFEYGEGRWSILGQALSPAAVPGRWTAAVAGADGQAETEADAQGEFRLAGLAPGVYEMSLRAAEREIVLPELRLEGGRH